MTISKSFATYLQSAGFGTLGTNLYIGGAPMDAPDTCMWILAGGGSPIVKNQTGEKVKQYFLSVFYRSTDAEDVDDTLHALEVNLNSPTCPQLTDFDTIEIECTSFPTDQDIDNENRTEGLLQVTITNYL
jgi:hypothetical protein